MKHPAEGRRDGGKLWLRISACSRSPGRGRPATGPARPRARTGRSGKHERRGSGHMRHGGGTMEASVRVATQLPAEDRPAKPGGPLWPLEEEMIARAAAGRLVDRGAGPSNLAKMQTWGQERTVRAEVLQRLLVAGQWPVHAKGVRLCGVRISGQLDFKGATLAGPLSLDSCYLDADRPAALDYATASLVTLTGCQLAGLTGRMLTARELDLRSSTLTRPLSLRGAVIGQLICGGAQLTGRDGHGYALTARGMKVSGNVYLDDGFTAAGPIRL